MIKNGDFLKIYLEIRIRLDLSRDLPWNSPLKFNKPQRIHEKKWDSTNFKSHQ
jgi:hypothetical protein